MNLTKLVDLLEKKGQGKANINMIPNYLVLGKKFGALPFIGRNNKDEGNCFCQNG